jgi:hypothetical protein
MKKSYTFKLIDGTFTPAEANRVLTDLVNSKIHFHEMENFSSQERFGTDVTHSARRLKALRKLKLDLKKIFDSTAEKHRDLKINSHIEILIVDK